MALSIISYNVLADSYIRPSFYPGVPAAFLMPEHRQSLLLRRIRDFAADVICLQEVEPQVFARVEAGLAADGYAGYFAQKRGKPDGCATFVQQGVSPGDAHTLNFSDGRGAETDSGHIALLLIVQGPYGRIGIANTHIKWDPGGTPQAKQWGYRQASQLLDHIGSAYERHTPWVVCGDFNAESDSDVISLFTTAGFVDAYRDHDKMYTCAPNQKAKRIDYIFHAGELTSQPLPLPLITDSTVLPSEQQPSDHVAIGAGLRRIGWAE
jgi:mRNA deadenylase 3'-5' endonuclease subunit Ccr4